MSSRDKIKSREDLAPLLAERQRSGSRIVFTNGCFDLLHVGHTRYLEKAKILGDVLVVGVNSDQSVRSLQKGHDRPIIPEAQRVEVLAALSCIDFVVLFHEPDPGLLIRVLQPDILVKGGDWSTDRIIGRDTVEERGGQVVTIPLVQGVSTSHIVRNIRRFNSE